MHDLFKHSTAYIEKEYGAGRITKDDAIQSLVKKQQRIKSQLNNCNKKGSFYLFTSSARKKLDDIAWAIQRIMTAEKKKEA